MRGLILLPFVAALALAACSSFTGDPEKQWYKPNVDYTAADFERDRVACTDKKKKLDEECLKQHGWIALGGDIGPPIKPPDPTKTPSPKGKY
jgi:hypothetical protein